MQPRHGSGVVHLIDAELPRAMRIAESESVEPCAKNDDLPDACFDSSCQSVFRNAASRGGDQASDAGQGVLVRKLKHVLFVFAENLDGKRVLENCAVIEQLMSSSLPRDHQRGAAGFIGLHAGLLPFDSVMDICPA